MYSRMIAIKSENFKNTFGFKVISFRYQENKFFFDIMTAPAAEIGYCSVLWH